jgi:SAM-dependent methyltransferase
MTDVDAPSDRTRRDAAATGGSAADFAADRANPVRAYAAFELDHWWYKARRDVVGSIVARLVPPSRDRLLVDVGCGPGANIGELADRYECIGVDNSAEAIELARERFATTTFLSGLAPAVLGPDAGRADVITLMDVLEHVEDDRAMLQALVDAAKPGAYFIVTVPAGPDLWSPHDDAVGHLRRYTTISLGRLWAGLPLEPVLFSYFNARLYPVVKTVRLVTRLLGRAHGGGHAASEGTDLKLPPALANQVLASLFAGETRRLLRVMDDTARPYPFGVSLIAALRKMDGRE